MAKKFSADYEATDVLDLYRVRSGETDEARIRRLIAEIRQYTRLEHAVNIPDTYRALTKELRTPFIRDAWHRITSSLVAKPPVAHIAPKDERRQEYRTSSSIAERWVMAFMDHQNKTLGSDMAYNLSAQLVRDGESVLKVVHRPQAWANFPDLQDDEMADDFEDRIESFKRTSALPIAWRDVDRLSILYEGGEYGDQWVMEYGEYAKPYLRDRYNMVDIDGHLVNPKNALGGRPYAEGLNPTSRTRSVKVEFFTPHEWHVLIDNTEAPGFPKKNPYAPHLPYFRAAAYDSESLLYSLLYLVPALDELLTMKRNWSILGAYPNPILRYLPNTSGMPALDGPLGNPGESTANDTVKWSPGEMIDLPPGRDLSFLVPPPVGSDLNDLIQILKGLIDIAGVPSIMRGMAGAGDSGYLANQLRAAAEMAYRLAALASQRQFEHAFEFILWLVSHRIHQTVYIHGWDLLSPISGKPVKASSKEWLGLSPDKQTRNTADISKLGSITFQYRPTLPTDEQARAMIALQLTNAQKPLSDRRHALETWLQEEDADSILDAIYVEQALDEEPLRTIVMERALREAGIMPPPPEPPALPPGQLPPEQMIQTANQLQPVPLVNQMPAGGPAVPGITMPPVPVPPEGIPGAPGGRPPGFFPGQPSGPNM